MLVGDPDILKVLLQFKDIKGVLDPGEMKTAMPLPAGKSKQDPGLFWFTKDKARFVGANSHAYVQGDDNNFMHNKLMILDDMTVITGSYNFSEHAERNDEKILLMQSPAIAQAYNQYFDALFQQYSQNSRPLPTV